MKRLKDSFIMRLIKDLIYNVLILIVSIIVLIFFLKKLSLIFPFIPF